MKCVVYYEKKKEMIIGTFPKKIDLVLRQKIEQAWSSRVSKEILKFLTKVESTTAPEIKAAIGHSMSTLHENIVKLESDGIISTEMVYEGNKKKLISAEVLFITKNSKITKAITKFLNQGLLVDSITGNKIIKFLDKNKDQSFTIEQISAKTGIQVDEIETLLSNWDNILTRAFSDLGRETPFSKIIYYQSKKSKKLDIDPLKKTKAKKKNSA